MILYSENNRPTAGAVAQLYQSSGVSQPITDLVRIQTMLDNTNLIISAWEESRLVGIARALTDYGYCCYLADLVVDRKYQKMSIGSSLIRLIQKAIGIEVSLALISAPDTTQFYEKLGFKSVTNGYIVNGIF